MAVLILIILVSAFWSYWTYRRWHPWRGAPEILSTDAANYVAEKRRKLLEEAGRRTNALPIRLGPLDVPLEMFSTPVILLGVPGGGKTSVLNMMGPSFLPLYDLAPGRTHTVYLDVKNEQYARQHAVQPPHVPIYLLNPLDARGAKLDWPATFANRSDIQQLAQSLCPPIAGDQNPFFRDNARAIIFSVVWVFQKARPHATRAWGLSDVVRACIDQRSLKRILARDPEARSALRSAIDPNTKSAGDVFSTLRSVLHPFADVALAEEQASQTFDLKRFVREDAVAILGLTSTNSQAILPLYSILIRRLIEEARTVSHPEDRLLLFLDELALLDRTCLESLTKATNVGRSHGICTFASSQSVELLESAFGREMCHAFLASCTTTVAFRCASKTTAEYACSRFGAQEGVLLVHSCTSSRQGGSSTTSEQHMQRPTLMPEELLHLPLADPIRDELTFAAACPTFGTAFVTTTFVRETTVTAEVPVPNVVPRDLGTRSLTPLSEDDLRQLGLS